jgi:inner membrane protein
MPSPVAHILGGAAVYLVAKGKDRSRLMLGIALLASIVPDFDFLPGILIGKMGAFHHGISHSLTFAVIFGALVFLFAMRKSKAVAVRASVLATLSYASHIGLDFVGVNEGTRGVPVLWPLSDEKFGFGLNLFGYFRWGDIRDGLGSIIRWDNVMPVVREFLLVGSLVLFLVWRERRSSKKRSQILSRKRYRLTVTDE